MTGEPEYGATFKTALSRFWTKYADFSGRASRSEFWWAVAFIAVTGAAIDVVAFASIAAAGFGKGLSTPPTVVLLYVAVTLVAVWGLALVVPSYAVTARRLHDTNRSGWFALVGFIPYLGPIILLVLLISPSSPLGQRFDRPPRATD